MTIEIVNYERNKMRVLLREEKEGIEYQFVTNQTRLIPVIETGETVGTPRQYKEFCERDVDDICPENN